MKMFNDLDSHPYSRKFECKTSLKAKFVNLEEKYWLKKFFDNTPNVEQVTDVTPGKVYDVVAYEVMGDVADITIINDRGERADFMECFFEEVN
ncbi:hypothetical protein KQI61_04415 [Anaerocolumna aminovalerica]|uniref:hypothetical protein n=1 Tax=Anaerocolumna aminovalerica TaxID=1527 RepID=UPI001C0EB282|nr:hypothetical protein [Anaerocolumna aminovalerica]MBU5331431.1 hypothetical protein [Anaerocolumna aminovalerica]